LYIFRMVLPLVSRALRTGHVVLCTALCLTLGAAECRHVAARTDYLSHAAAPHT